MSNTSKKWRNAFAAFIDRRAIIMLFLGFSAGIPILLIFSSLSLWLGEAGIDKAAVTMFSWAALGYSFKFVWAPIIDEIPLPYLTQRFGRRRAWLLTAQCLIIAAICLMAMTDPALGQHSLWQMAIGAVLLGFASATQDIVIDAYRIELADSQMQTVLASTYNAGYRIGMIVAGAGALFIAAGLGTAKGNYLYTAWQNTYLIMAVVMLVGIATTLSIAEPKLSRQRQDYAKSDYLRLLLVFCGVVICFVSSFVFVAQLIANFKPEDALASFAIEALHLLVALAAAVGCGFVLVKSGAVNQQMAVQTWVAPIADFFKRYGTKLALVLLLLIGFYRISDIIAGVISNVFYQDMNFSKEQIAEAVKIYGVFFTLLGGFLGGVLSQRFNIMKVMFISAILASSTNLIFIGLVKSGLHTSAVAVQIGNQQYQVHSDEVGYWKIDVPKAQLQQASQILTQVYDLEHPQQLLSRTLPYLKQNALPSVQMQILPMSGDNVLQKNELKQKTILVRGQIFGLSPAQLAAHPQVTLELAHQRFRSAIDAHGIFAYAFSGAQLMHNQPYAISASYSLGQQQVQTQLNYRVDLTSPQPEAVQLENVLDPLPLIDQSTGTQQVSGKVIKAYSKIWLYFAIIMDNLASGMAGAAFIAFLSSLTSVSFTAVQYAIFSSLMTLTPKILGGYSGSIVNHIGYPNFFLMTTCIGIPILILVAWVAKLLAQQQQRVD
jgi:PAT family beta-lactamase induction signal transducer AmpG